MNYPCIVVALLHHPVWGRVTPGNSHHVPGARDRVVLPRAAHAAIAEQAEAANRAIRAWARDIR